ncbi:fructosamine/Ketosamine-3-kinase [Nitritalea halalkaliphila LW7]|uniref:Fructosamine/Ketosamine-3-kinase n=1 Tax=Nitritalea halalkaliphila LW7 TaxID=1189621 RepID=I5BZ67_9BACT|nr:fructosamine kinase family protein [Nitritalea halalkaliphila]EIM74869.1 fructosamine/Ketosamine-3-kinase [Nitritalea halalkaliphila LW7]
MWDSFDQEAFFQRVLLESFGKNEKILQQRLVAAGTLNQGIFLETESGAYFLKLNHSDNARLLVEEAASLKLLSAHCPLEVPAVHQVGQIEDQHYLLMDFIREGHPQADYWAELGEGLAALHMATRPTFGLERDNYIATIAQPNSATKNWSTFFIEQRLEPLAGKAFFDGHINASFLDRFRRLYPLLEELLPKERPALLHGDLWSGNVMKSATGRPVLIDPAAYYGHREMDLAFSQLFGGFDPRFYAAYTAVFPLEPGFEERRRYTTSIHCSCTCIYLAAVT